jgi:hypothetical protein
MLAVVMGSSAVMGHGGGPHPMFVVAVGSVRPWVMPVVVAESAVLLAPVVV